MVHLGTRVEGVDFFRAGTTCFSNRGRAQQKNEATWERRGERGWRVEGDVGSSYHVVGHGEPCLDMGWLNEKLKTCV